MTTLFRLFSHLPLWLLHGLGWILGWVSYLGSAAYRQRFSENVAFAGVSVKDKRRAVGEAGKMIAELPRLWMGEPVTVHWAGAQHVEAALANGKGVVFLTPHMGCFEITGQAYAARFGVKGHPVTALFRPPRKAWLHSVVNAARTRPGLDSAPTTLAGVKQLFKALKNGHCVGLLPDQVPPQGMGVWAPFFGQPAYTMVLSARLAIQSGATVMLVWGERLSWGRGYVMHAEPMPVQLSRDITQAVVQINRAMEHLILQKPSQYLWGYARYKNPRSDDL